MNSTKQTQHKNSLLIELENLNQQLDEIPKRIDEIERMLKNLNEDDEDVKYRRKNDPVVSGGVHEEPKDDTSYIIVTPNSVDKCLGRGSNGKQCRNYSKIGNFCKIHLDVPRDELRKKGNGGCDRTCCQIGVPYWKHWGRMDEHPSLAGCPKMKDVTCLEWFGVRLDGEWFE